MHIFIQNHTNLVEKVVCMEILFEKGFAEGHHLVAKLTMAIHDHPYEALGDTLPRIRRLAHAITRTIPFLEHTYK